MSAHAQTFTARNRATQSENRIHADDVAQQYGFRGGLVPGVTSYAYVAEAVLDRFGLAWLAHGRLAMRLSKPVYDGDAIIVDCFDDGQLSLRDPSGVECVAGRAGPDPIDLVEVSLPAAADLPNTRPRADEHTLAIGTVLGTFHHAVSAEQQAEFLDSVSIPERRCEAEGLVHPGVLILDANAVLVRNVLLGPWIHVGSDVSLLRPVRFDEPLEVRSVVTDRYERKGHRFVELDVLTLAADEPASFVHHTAIYEPRVER